MRRATLVVVMLLAAACAKADPPPAASGLPSTTPTAASGPVAPGTLDLIAKDIAFSTSSLAAPPGEVTIQYDNQDGGTPHNLHVAGNGVDAKTDIEEGPTTQTLTVELEAGTYTFVCDVHPQQMKGELTVG